MAVQIQLAVYDNLLATSRVRFVEYHINRLREHITHFHGLQREQTSQWGQVAIRRNERILSITRAWDALELDSKPGDYKPTEEYLRYQRILERGFKEFGDRFWEQREMLKSGTFVAKIKSTLARVPAVKHLRIHDNDDKIHLPSQTETEMSVDVQLFNDSELCKALSKRQPMSYGLQHHHALASDAVQLIPLILAACDAPDIRPLVSLELELSTIRTFFALSLADDKHHRIRSAMRNLKVFRFIHRGPVLVRSDREFEILRDFLAPIVNAETMESLVLQSNLWNDEESILDPAALPLVGIIKTQTMWPRLSSLTLDTLHIKHSDLTHLLNCVDSSRGFVGLSKIHLTDGSWATILDVLKDRHGWSNLVSPSGAECETMSVNEYEELFGSYSRSDSRTQEDNAWFGYGPREAEMYIRGWRTGNPLRVPLDLPLDLQD